tara:strand:- start:698 stop:1261 length:564 start_codon:yes stop_codon:yes gene_type:complete
MVFGTQDHAFFPSIRGRGLTRGVPLAPTVVLLVLLGAGVTEAQPRLSPEAVARAAPPADWERPPSRPPPPTYRQTTPEVGWLLALGGSTVVSAGGLLPLARYECHSDSPAPTGPDPLLVSTATFLAVGVAAVTAGLVRLALGGRERTRRPPRRGRRILLFSALATIHGGALAGTLFAAHAESILCHS